MYRFNRFTFPNIEICESLMKNRREKRYFNFREAEKMTSWLNRLYALSHSHGDNWFDIRQRLKTDIQFANFEKGCDAFL